MDEKSFFTLVPRNIFYIIIKHLYFLQDQKNVALTCRQWYEWVYACSKELSDQERMHDAVLEECLRLLHENSRLFPWQRDKNIWRKSKQISAQVPSGLSRFLNEQSAQLGRTFFQKVEYDVIHCRGSKLCEVISQGHLRQALLNVLYQIPETKKVIDVLDSEIKRYQFFIHFMEMYHAGNIALYVVSHRESLTEDYLLELECNNEPEAAIEEARAKLDDLALIQFATKRAKWFDLAKLQREQKLFMDVKVLVIAEYERKNREQKIAGLTN